MRKTVGKNKKETVKHVEYYDCIIICQNKNGAVQTSFFSFVIMVDDFAEVLIRR